jgi:hypothetical protein
MRHSKRKNPRDGLHRQTKNPQKRTAKRVHKLSYHEQQDLIATPWQIWERKEADEYIEPEYTLVAGYLITPVLVFWT